MNNFEEMVIVFLMGLPIIYLFKYFLERTVNSISKLMADIENNRQFKAKQDAVAKMKAEGDFHEWIQIPLADNGIPREIMVCKKTGWSPTLQGFVPMQKIESYLDALETEKQYKSFRTQRVAKLSAKLALSTEETEKIVDEIFSMKKDFTLIRIAQLQQEMMNRSQAVKDAQGN